MKRIIILMLLMMIPIVSAVGVVEYGGELPINTFLNLDKSAIRNAMALTFNETRWGEGQLEFYYDFWTVTGNFDDGFMIVRIRERASLDNDLIYWCLDNYTIAQCRAGLLMMNEPFDIGDWHVDPVVYQINQRIDYEVEYLLWLQDYIENEGNIEDFVEGFDL